MFCFLFILNFTAVYFAFCKVVTMSYFEGKGCEIENWVYSFKIGETSNICRPLKFFDDHFYGRTYCNITQGIFTTTHFNGSKCLFHLYDHHIHIDSECTAIEEQEYLPMFSKGDCDFTPPSGSARVSVSPFLSCSAPPEQYMDHYVKTNVCFGYTNPPEMMSLLLGNSKENSEFEVSSARLECGKEGEAVFSIYKDVGCKEPIIELELFTGKCVSEPGLIPSTAFVLNSGC